MTLRKTRPWPFSELRESGTRGRTDERAVRTRQRRSRKLLLESLEPRVLLATDIRSFTDLDLSPPGELLIEIGGTSPGHSAGNENDGYDQIQVAGQATVGGTLQVALVNNYVPAVGTEYDFLTSGSVSGQFADAKGLFSFPDGDRYFRVVQESDRLKLVVTAAPGMGIRFQPNTDLLRDGLGEFLNDYFDVTTFGYTGELSVADFFHLQGQVAVEKSTTTLKLADGTTVATDLLTLGGSDLTAFAGVNGP
ncbi:MAG: LEPR-XLL domain-containing protein, partial [Planctomycetota bacterium]|nr:LEPR-XLL domain-containing protein [Planctomycetota bacterium]